MEEQALKALLELISEASPRLWELAERQAMINGTLNTIYLAIGIFILVMFVVSLVRIKQDIEGPITASNAELWMAVAAATFVIGGITVAASINSVITFALNPDYYTLWQLIDLIDMVR